MYRRSSPGSLGEFSVPDFSGTFCEKLCWFTTCARFLPVFYNLRQTHIKQMVSWMPRLWDGEYKMWLQTLSTFHAANSSTCRSKNSVCHWKIRIIGKHPGCILGWVFFPRGKPARDFFCGPCLEGFLLPCSVTPFWTEAGLPRTGTQGHTSSADRKRPVCILISAEAGVLVRLPPEGAVRTLCLLMGISHSCKA